MEACAVNETSEPAPCIDAQTLAACQQGDREAFRRLFEVYKDRVFSIAVYFLQGDVATAEDITQEVFVRVYTRLKQFRRESEFTTWLYRLTANACMDEFRRQKRRPATVFLEAGGLEASGLEKTGLEAGGAETRNGPEAAYARLELSADIQAALADLAPEMRLTILLRYFDELSYEEIAVILECSQGTVASRINRSLKTLARKLTHLRDDV